MVFGREDKFLNTFASLAKIAPFIPLAGADARFQPVSVSDVAKAVFACVEDQGKDTLHNTYDLVGTEIFTLKELVKLSALSERKSALAQSIRNRAAHRVVLKNCLEIQSMRRPRPR